MVNKCVRCNEGDTIDAENDEVCKDWFILEEFIQINVRAGERQMKAHESLQCTIQEEHVSCLIHLNA